MPTTFLFWRDKSLIWSDLIWSELCSDNFSITKSREAQTETSSRLKRTDSIKLKENTGLLSVQKVHYAKMHYSNSLYDLLIEFLYKNCRCYFFRWHNNLNSFPKFEEIWEKERKHCLDKVSLAKCNSGMNDHPLSQLPFTSSNSISSTNIIYFICNWIKQLF